MLFLHLPDFPDPSPYHNTIENKKSVRIGTKRKPSKDREMAKPPPKIPSAISLIPGRKFVSLLIILSRTHTQYFPRIKTPVLPFFQSKNQSRSKRRIEFSKMSERGKYRLKKFFFSRSFLVKRRVLQIPTFPTFPTPYARECHRRKGSRDSAG